MTHTATADQIEWMRAHVESYETDVKHYDYSLPVNALTFPSGIDQLRAAVDQSGSKFFSPDTLRWWKSKIGTTLAGGRFFTTSERNFDDTRSHHVRWVYQSPDTAMLSVGRFDQAFATAKAARDFAAHSAAALRPATLTPAAPALSRNASPARTR